MSTQISCQWAAQSGKDVQEERRFGEQTARDVRQMADAQNGEEGGQHSGVPGSGKRARSD